MIPGCTFLYIIAVEKNVFVCRSLVFNQNKESDTDAKYSNIFNEKRADIRKHLESCDLECG